ncbi:PH, RCC1 and FYVE domains-containing protein 1-like isoform X1 [Dioscorea cayenensis subsp. rotundata]|uniref:PH, RCC1 and FYVE domains-containing protein 1-like isoform X1 n=1 Tax=Dioscorea cayennensis subsp. rotundata TaxID=55577 RepID=A0AB40AQ91_DIOCR|nr:PH, RCC1 and FYVE domains-containing protein 1-like isoform X1 [Dioscorea cayenensis subsp. rotundata]
MADPFVATPSTDRDADKALVALKKGSQLLKYGRKGKPKFCLFRLSNDESSLIWLSSSGERTLKLASVSKIIPGQRTPVFQRYLRPEKDYLSFSLIYNNGKRSLDLICKDKVEAEVWFAGLRALISSGQCGRSKIDGWSDGGLYFDEAKDLRTNRTSDSSVSTILDVSSPDSNLNPGISSIDHPENLRTFEKSDVTNMQGKGIPSDVFRVSVSSTHSTSSHGSAPDDCDALGDVYVWGEVICDSSAWASTERSNSPIIAKTDILLPKPLESNLVLDVHHVACGVRHAALVTRQGEMFTWGEESGGRLGHGVGTDVIHPRLVESLSVCNIDYVACGQFHTCAVTASGELYTWGDGTHNVGLLGHGTDVSHWIPKRVSGPLEGLQVAYVTCGTWHTALVTSAGQLFTFGDGTFGVLGHGNRESVSYPKEVESLMGLKTIAVACGVWHTAAIVDVIVTQSSASASSGKLFTWGDGDKFRLGHGDKEARLKPTCVPSLIDFNFHKLACGHSLTIGLTTSGRVFAMGSTVYGQLGNPQSDGKLPCMVEDKLASESVAEVSCGSYHVTVLTTKNEVYTWGKGANGRLGHGDFEDRKTPTLVEALKDRTVKRIACGSNFTAAICNHKWVSGAEQSQCSACRQAFGFTRKRHNCYNCGLVHCHSCSSRKALRAALSPNPGKPYRVCDTCYLKLNKVLESSGINNKRNTMPRLSGENKDRFDKVESKLLKTPPLASNLDLIKNLDVKAAKNGKKSDTLSFTRASQAPSILRSKDTSFIGGFDLHQAVPRPVQTSTTHSVNQSRAVSPFSRKSSPPRSATPVPTTSGLSFSKNVTDSLKRTNELLNQEIQKLRAQVDGLRHRCELQEFELQKSSKKAQEAMALAAEEAAKSKVAKEVIKSLTAQLKDMAERLPHGVYENDQIRPTYPLNGIDSHALYHSNLNEDYQLNNDASSSPANPPSINSVVINGLSAQNHSPSGSRETNELDDTHLNNHRVANSNQEGEYLNSDRSGNAEMPISGRREDLEGRGAEPRLNGENVSNSRSPTSNNQVEAEWIEQYEPGVYITLVALRDGTRDLKRVRFSRRRFGEHQAESWWSENRTKVYEKYNVRGSDRASAAVSTQSVQRFGES